MILKGYECIPADQTLQLWALPSVSCVRLTMVVTRREAGKEEEGDTRGPEAKEGPHHSPHAFPEESGPFQRLRVFHSGITGWSPREAILASSLS